jgi:hypothetical protein
MTTPAETARCQTCHEEVPLTPKARVLRVHRDAEGVRCPGTGRKPMVIAPAPVRRAKPSRTCTKCGTDVQLDSSGRMPSHYRNGGECLGAMTRPAVTSGNAEGSPVAALAIVAAVLGLIVWGGFALFGGGDDSNSPDTTCVGCVEEEPVADEVPLNDCEQRVYAVTSYSGFTDEEEREMVRAIWDSPECRLE